MLLLYEDQILKLNQLAKGKEDDVSKYIVFDGDNCFFFLLLNCVYGLIKVRNKGGKENGKNKLALFVLVDGCD